MLRHFKKRYHIAIVINIIVLLITVFLSFGIGRFAMSFSEILNVILNRSTIEQHYTLLYHIRLPRVILVVISGAALALAGTVFQKLFRNPLVSPDVVGVTSGCSLGAVFAIIFFNSSMVLLQLFSFAFGIITMILVLIFARMININKSVGIIIAGIVISSLSSSFIMMLKYTADPNKHLASIDFWMMGGFSNANWRQVVTILPLILISALILYLLRWKLNVLTLGFEQATSLGVRVKAVRFISLTASTLLVSSVVSVAGLVSWIGLLAPHVVNIYCEDDVAKSIPLSMFTGAILLLVADTISRTITASELPISILTSLVGAPFLMYLAWERGKSR